MSEQKTYFLNDPTTPELITAIPIPPPTLPALDVVGFVGPCEPNTNEYHAASCYITLNNCLNYVQNILKNNGGELLQWVRSNHLTVRPLAGVGFNAYYDGSSLNYLYKQNIYTADSADVVAHEMGHAILDALRSGLFSLGSMETAAFHEAFGDIIAILGVMQHDLILNQALKETNGDLKQSNIISKIGEQLGQAIYTATNHQKGYPNTLRDATIIFDYVNPTTLPTQGGYEILINECHSFGRVFMCAWYEIMCNIFNQEKQSQPLLEALKTARDMSARYLLSAIRIAPTIVKFLKAVAESMITVAKTENSKYTEIIKQVFISHNIISENGLNSLSTRKLPEVLQFLKHDDDITEYAHGTTIRTKNQRTIKLSEYVLSKQDLDNPFYSAEIEMPADTYCEFDKMGNLVMGLQSDDHELVSAAVSFVQSITEHNPIINGVQMWTVQEGKLIRNFVD